MVSKEFLGLRASCKAWVPAAEHGAQLQLCLAAAVTCPVRACNSPAAAKPAPAAPAAAPLVVVLLICPLLLLSSGICHLRPSDSACAAAAAPELLIAYAEAQVVPVSPGTIFHAHS